MKYAAMTLISGAALFASTPAVYAGIQDGLVAHYCFDDASNLGKDCSTNGNNGVLEGNVIKATGYNGSGALFGGFNNPAAVHVPNSSSLQFQQDFSVSVAVKMTTFSGMDGWGSSADYGIHSLFAKSHDRNGVALMAYGDGSSGSVDVAGHIATYGWTPLNWNNPTVAPNAPANEWVHLTWVFSNSKHVAQFYADGVLIATDNGFSQDFSEMNNQDLYLGKFSDYWFPLNGVLDEVRVYNRALNKAEVVTLFKQGGPLSGTVNRLGAHTVTCTNNATRQQVQIPSSSATVFDCESVGFQFNPGQNVTITISGKTK